MVLAAVPAAAQHAHTLTRTFGFPRTGRAALGIKAGPLTFTELIIRNPPNAEDLREAKTNPSDNCHPKLAIGVTNTGRSKMEFHVTVSLEDGRGKIYMTCDRNDSIDPGAQNDHTNLCWLESMKTIDWPRVTRVRLVAEIDPET